MRTNYESLYNAKKGTIQDCLDVIQSGDVVAFAAACNAPVEMLNHMHTIADRVTGVKCIKGHEGIYPFVTMDGMDGHINTGSFFFGRDLSNGMKNGNTSFIPADMCDYSTFTSGHFPCNVFVAAATPMDENGNMQVGLCMMYEDAAYASADRIILEVNPNLPRVRGGLEININDVTCLLEADYPINVVPDADPTPEEIMVAKNVRSLVKDGDCIQLGIGSLPNAIANEMMDLKDLGLHTEMATSTMGKLIQAGVITGARKNFKQGQHLFIFAGGTPELYQTLSENPSCRIVPAVYGADPAIIMKNDNMVSINTCIEMDLTGQICSESIGPRVISGSGGAFDYVYGALHARGGRSIMAFTSKTKKGVSKIVDMLSPGAGVTIPRNYADYIVTEYGIAPLRGRSLEERARALIAIAHPDCREELTYKAKKLYYI
ncbi:MAG: 4-hydroxybutyrate--acetyl-CoA CoA transferase [Oscillospiraceae bacterium]|nr:4-hydroxybutyrate--acetyl-CoA CoA transferase [Oscillospiraceae bacterium]